MGQVIGRSIMLVDMLTKGRVQTRAREEMGIAWNQLDPGKWYDCDSTMGAYLRSVDKKLFGSKRGLYEVGKGIVPTTRRLTKVMNRFSDVITALKGMDAAFQMNNRGDDIGGFIIEKASESSMTIRENTHHFFSE
ncbi:hypothetical protein K8R78_04835, partial [bacterium]|nr:hypothetical protein [bacterium]